MSLAFSSFACGCHLIVIILLHVIILDVTRRRGESAGEKARDDANCLLYVQLEKKNKTGTSGCGLFVVAYFQPATSIDHLHKCCILHHNVQRNYKTERKKKGKKHSFIALWKQGCKMQGMIVFRLQDFNKLNVKTMHYTPIPQGASPLHRETTEYIKCVGCALFAYMSFSLSFCYLLPFCV